MLGYIGGAGLGAVAGAALSSRSKRGRNAGLGALAGLAAGAVAEAFMGSSTPPGTVMGADGQLTDLNGHPVLGTEPYLSMTWAPGTAKAGQPCSQGSVLAGLCGRAATGG